jgi:hypothetical protein
VACHEQDIPDYHHTNRVHQVAKRGQHKVGGAMATVLIYTRCTSCPQALEASVMLMRCYLQIVAPLQQRQLVTLAGTSIGNHALLHTTSIRHLRYTRLKNGISKM